MHHFKIVIFTVLFILLVKYQGNTAQDPGFLSFARDSWVTQTLSGLSIDEKIAQLIMLTAYPNQGEIHRKQLIKLVEKYRPGGILVMKGDPTVTAKLINDLQQASKTPLLIATDGETGLGFRLDSTISYPNAQALGAVSGHGQIYKMGVDIGKQFKQLGIHINFAPVADVNTNPLNPVINSRSFGEDKKNVAKKAWAFASGMQDAGIIAVAKHFPGHGDTKTDSHKTLPVLNKSVQQIDSVEAYPFKHLIDSGISGIMSAHINVNSFDPTGIPASLSQNMIKKYLRETLGFNGFVVTDAMNMKGVGQPSGKAELEALKAGNDMVEFIADISKTIQEIKTAITIGEIDEKEIEAKCRKILAIKRWAGLDNYQPAELTNITQKLNEPLYYVTLRKLVENSLTVLKNQAILPIEGLDTLKIASVSIGSDSITAFQKMLEKYTVVENFTISKEASEGQLKKLETELKPYNLVIGGIHKINRYPYRKYGITNTQFQAYNMIRNLKKSVFVLFGNAYALVHFEGIENSEGLVLAYQDTKLTQELSAQLLFGAFNASGKLPVSIGNKFKAGFGLKVENKRRLKYTIPEELGINSENLTRQIDSISKLGVDSAAFPGCQVLIAKEGKVIFHKCYGFHTYKKNTPVTSENIYDWASITKICGPLPALMKLYSEGKFDLDLPFSNYWPAFKGSDKEGIPVRDVLAHQSGLQAWIPFWMETLKKNNNLKSSVFKHQATSNFSVRVSSNLYMNRRYQKTIFKEIKESPLLKKKEYVYSGLAFYLFPSIIKNLSNTNYETYLNQQFYHPLGAFTITHNPYKHLPVERIVPTEYDDIFRKELLQGYVHDEGAAMMGGVSGNAGLFGTASDLAKLMQMYLQKGFYGGKQYLPEETIEEFTRRQFPDNDNRRGLGFDKPKINNYKNELDEAYPAINASDNSFGHSGYTGTFTWADPENKLLFILMSNRVHPSRENSKIYELNIRPAMHQAIYDCIREGL